MFAAATSTNGLAGLLFGALAAIGLGFSDFCAARAGRTEKSMAVTRTALVTAAILSPILLLVAPSRFSVRDSLIAAASGLFMGSGLTLLYEGYRSSRIGIVGPTSSVLSGVVPIVYGLSNGDQLKSLQIAGMLLGLVALGLTSYAPGGEGNALRGSLLGCSSGFLFGFAFVLMARTSKASGLTIIVVQRWSAFAFLALLLPLSGPRLLALRKPGRTFAMATGVFAGIGLASLQLGLRRGSTSLVSVATSQFATVTVLLSVLIDRERLRATQVFGVACTAVAVALMALG